MTSPWKVIGKTPGSFTPKILSPRTVEKYCVQNKSRFIISACDIDYFESRIESLISYEHSNCSIPYLIFVFCEDPAEEASLRLRISKIREAFNIRKSLVELFACDGIQQLKNKVDNVFYKEYLINYIRCSRFALVGNVWKIMGTSNIEQTISRECCYIIDYDNYILDDFNRDFKKIYGEKNAVFCWDSEASARADFPEKLSTLYRKSQKYSINFSLSHASIKAGFTSLSPSYYSRLFLTLFNAYSIGSKIDDSFTNHRIFSFYYGDQLSMLTVLREIREIPEIEYKKVTGWIDISSSTLVSLSKDAGAMMWCPKGNNQFLRQIDPKHVKQRQ